MKPFQGCDIAISHLSTTDIAQHFHIQWEEHYRAQQSGSLTDLLLLAGGILVPVHQAVLLPLSQLLSQVVSLPCCRQTLHTISLPGVDLASVLSMVRLVYTGRCNVTTGLEYSKLVNLLETLGINIQHTLVNCDDAQQDQPLNLSVQNTEYDQPQEFICACKQCGMQFLSDKLDDICSMNCCFPIKSSNKTGSSIEQILPSESSQPGSAMTLDKDKYSAELTIHGFCSGFGSGEECASPSPSKRNEMLPDQVTKFSNPQDVQNVKEIIQIINEKGGEGSCVITKVKTILKDISNDGLKNFLKEHFGYTDFRGLQRPALELILNSEIKNLIFVFPTGDGKSLLWQYALKYYPTDLHIILTPLNALKDQQSDQLKALSINHVNFDKKMSREQFLDKIYIENIKVIIVTPEKLFNHFDLFLKLKIKYIFVEECHLFVLQSLTFRYKMKELGDIINQLHMEKMIFLTATLSPVGERQLLFLFNIKPGEFTTLKKDNIRINIETRRTFKPIKLCDQEKMLIETIKKDKNELSVGGNFDGRIQVFCWSKQSAERTSIVLGRALNSKTEFYHSRSKNKQQKLAMWLAGNIDIMCHTSSFGTGMDKDDVLLLIIFGMPCSPYDLDQVRGRLGRNGKKAICHILFNPVDYFRMRGLIVKGERGVPRNTVAIENQLEEASEVYKLFEERNMCFNSVLGKLVGNVNTVNCDNCYVCVENYIDTSDGSKSRRTKEIPLAKVQKLLNVCCIPRKLATIKEKVCKKYQLKPSTVLLLVKELEKKKNLKAEYIVRNLVTEVKYVKVKPLDSNMVILHDGYKVDVIDISCIEEPSLFSASDSELCDPTWLGDGKIIKKSYVQFPKTLNRSKLAKKNVWKKR